MGASPCSRRPEEKTHVIDTEDVERRIRHTMKALADIPIVDRGPLPGEPRATRIRGSDRHWLVNVLVVGLVLGIVAVAVAFGPLRSRRTGPISQSPSSAHPPQVKIPKGWKTYTYKKAEISVPESWTTSPCPDSSATGRLILGTQPIIFCPESAYRGTATVTLSVPSAAAIALARKDRATCGTTRVNGLVVWASRCAIPGNFDDYIQWIFPSLGIEAVSTSAFDSDGQRGRVLHTIRRR